MKYPNITSALLVLTHRCNLACRYCFVKQEASDMPLATAKKTVDYVMNNLLNDTEEGSITFFGGEPLLKWNEIIVPTVLYTKEKYPNKKCNFSITSNCVLLTEDKISFIKEHNINLLTSIDGAKTTQDYNRPFHNGQGSFDIVEKNLKLYRDLVGLQNTTFRATVYPDSCENLFENYLYAIDFGYPSMFFVADSFSDWSDEKERILTDEMGKIVEHYVNHWKTFKKPPIQLNPFMRDFNLTLQEINRDLMGQDPIVFRSQSKCGYGQGHAVAVSPAGDLYGCQEMTSNEGPNSLFYVGHIDTGVEERHRIRLKEIFESTEQQGDMKCKDCVAKGICNGGCVANNYMSTGDMNRATHGHCFFTRIVYATNLVILNSLQDVPEFIEYIKSLEHTGCGNCQGCQSAEK